MNLEQMQTMWQSHNEKLDECVSLNKRLLQEKKIDSQKGELNKLIVTRAIEGFIFFVIVFLLWKYIISSWSYTAPVVSAFILNIFAIAGLAGNIGQIALLNKVDFSKPIKKTLIDLIAVRSHNLNIFKLIMLSIPLYMAYVFLGYDIIFGVDLFSLMSEETKTGFAAISIVFGGVIVFLIKKLKPENRNNKLIGWLFNEISGERLTHLLDEIENMEKARV
ncbi:hypothetical protein C1E23_20100 [Pseudoalteromonas phenolica]|uniref:Uncharacterized protein n=1 Tax=Pseudoalteromonas phenolica TaxID=161398 RepID=A0A4Q7IIA0_9GAMM|nr:hypothetical protein [Pseudoalteromonas phenolica]RZQ51305.1 hypothetical protein C1E23_20100 [Pseudoalteromonas phenolica]